MTSILVVNSSPMGEASVSRKLVDKFVEEWKAKKGDADVVSRDVSTESLPHLDGAILGAFFTPADDRNAEQAEAVACSERLIGEVNAADVLVIGAPMHNFGIPSTLKAWIDHICRVGETFQYTDDGPVGLLEGKKAYVITSRGGVYADGSPAAGMDFVGPYLKSVLGFMGITDVEIIAAEGLAMGEDAVREGVAKAEESIANTLAA